MTEKEVLNIIEKKISSKAFNSEIKKIIADVLVEFFKVVWQKKSNWYNDVQK